MPGSARRLIAIAVLTALMPWAGAVLSGQPLNSLLEFPLNTRSWDPPGISRTYTQALQLITTILVSALIWLIWPRKRGRIVEVAQSQARPWPRYAWLSVLLLITVFVAIDGAALNAGIGLLTLALTLLINADTERRTGSSLISQRRGYFLILFPISMAAGWLFFYWLNLFAGLWIYPRATETVPFALGKSLDYASLLPALLSLRQWLGSFPRLLSWTSTGVPIGTPLGANTAQEGGILIAIASIALATFAAWPEVLYPLMLIAPAMLGIGLQIFSRQTTSLAGIARGDWSRPLLTTLAALLLMAFGQALNFLLGSAWTFQLPLLGGIALLGLPAPAWLIALPLAVLGIWLADQVTEPFKRRPQRPSFRSGPRVQIPLVDVLRKQENR